MADHSTEHKPGSQDIKEQQKTFDGFLRYTVWTCVIVTVVLIFLAIVGT